MRTGPTAREMHRNSVKMLYGSFTLGPKSKRLFMREK